MTPMPTGFRIDEIWAWVVVDPRDDCEGVITMHSASGPMPCIVAQRELAEQMRPVAEKVSQALAQPVKLARFSVREDVETVDLRRGERQ